MPLQNTAFGDEAVYLCSGHIELEHLLHGTAPQGQYGLRTRTGEPGMPYCPGGARAWLKGG